MQLSIPLKSLVKYTSNLQWGKKLESMCLASLNPTWKKCPLSKIGAPKMVSSNKYLNK